MPRGKKVSPNTITPAPRPPFPGVENVCGWIQPSPTIRTIDPEGRYVHPDELKGFPDPGDCSPHEPVVFLPYERATAVFNSRRWPAGSWVPTRGPLGNYHQPLPYQTTNPQETRTDADFYPGLEGDALMASWFAEVAKLSGWDNIQFYGRSVLLISKLVR